MLIADTLVALLLTEGLHLLRTGVASHQQEGSFVRRITVIITGIVGAVVLHLSPTLKVHLKMLMLGIVI